MNRSIRNELSRDHLAPYAVSEETCRGREHVEAAPTFRSPFQRDRDRIVHSSAFRRLEYKTQVFVNHEGDMFRTRLTHTLEVAQIARTVARALNLNEDLTETIALAHDLGHAPFGHAGQTALNKCMQKFGGFEHNRQSLRIVQYLEDRYLAFRGLNLLFESREGILKHCNADQARSLGALGHRFIARHQPSLEAQLANIADEIAYNHHDIDDGMRANLLHIRLMLDSPLFARFHKSTVQKWPQAPSKQLLHSVIRAMMNYFITDLIQSTQARLAQIVPRHPDEIRSLEEPLVDFSPQVRAEHLQLKRILRTQLYHHDRVLENADRAQIVVEELFNNFFFDPNFIEPADTSDLDPSSGCRAQLVADYVAGMTDRFALSEHKRIFRTDKHANSA
ncbi:MAG: deoxyguanosinetriphosphate triphosphohydrolase [Proteobacteria bacterium]|nr:deoxyguanosinetriphosphate triphosphohydrolase [Pseudomonadota bacterium]